MTTGDDNMIITESTNTQDPATQLAELTAQMKQAEERAVLLQAENATLKATNESLLAASGDTELEARNRFQRRVDPMQSLDGTTPAANARTVRLPRAGTSAADAVRDEVRTQVIQSLLHPNEATTTQSTDDPHLVLRRLEDIEAMIQRLPGGAPPITKSAPNCYADTPFTDEIALVEMPKRFVVPSMKMYDGTANPDNHIAQYKQRMFTTAI